MALKAQGGLGEHPESGLSTPRIRLLTAVAVTAVALLAVSSARLAAADTVPKPPHVWLDADRESLPFQGKAEIEDFLRGARVVGREEIGVGINRLDRLLVERDGVRAHAIFRTVDEVDERLRMGDRLYMRFKDSWSGECAAYAVAQLFGIDNVPPTVERDLDSRRGSLQIWVEKARDPASEGFSPPSAIAWVQQTWGMIVFDNLVFNADRNAGNVLAGQHYRLWLIDHTRAFQPVAELLSPEKVVRLRRRAWTRLLEISGEELADATREFLDPDQVGALKERRRLLVEHIQGLIDERGEDAVLY